MDTPSLVFPLRATAARQAIDTAFSRFEGNKHEQAAKSSTGKPLAKSTTRAIFSVLREFILWLSQQDRFRSRVKARDAAYFNLSRRDEAEARAATERPAPSITQAKRALSLMPAGTPRELRDKAVFSLLSLSGIRVAALVTLRIKHNNLVEKSVTQNPREVATKFASKWSLYAKRFPEADEVLAAWLKHLDEMEFYGPDDALFPATALKATVATDFKVKGFDRRTWKTTQPVRKIVNGAFDNAGMPAFGPHAFRHMLARHAARTCTSVAVLVATSQNLGHTDVLPTLRSYGQNSREPKRALITGEQEESLFDDQP